jgi:hypothetical protein
MNYKDIIVVEDFEEAEQFRYEHNDEPVEVGTSVGCDQYVTNWPQGKSMKAENGSRIGVILKCFDGIYFQEQE